MSGQGTELPKETKEGGDPRASHTFSANATPFEPSGNTTPYAQDGVQEESPSIGSAATWGFQPQYYNMMMMSANLNAMAQMNALFAGGMRRYSGTPIVRASSPNLKGNNASESSKKLDKNSLSIDAKPWSPTPESTLSQGDTGDSYAQLKKGSIKVLYRGEMVVAPLPLKEINNLFVHSFILRPLEKPKIHLELFNYMCARCPMKSFFGRLSCRGPDVTLKWIAGDVPPLRIAHLIEQVTGAVVCALFTKDDQCEYELWLEKPEKSTHLVNTVSGALWTCPMFHGYAVFAKSDEEKSFLRDYLISLSESFPEPTPYPICCVEATTSPTTS